MRLGLISDIHADKNGLDHAIKLLRREQVKRIISAGDAVEKGPDGDAVIELLQAEGVISIAGNHDRDAINNQAWLRENGDPTRPPALKTHWLNDETLAFLKALPKELRFSLEGTQLFVAHGTPWGDANYVFPTSRRAVYERVARTAASDIVILGHTHIPMLAQINGVTICNPGSVCGKLSSGSHSCAVLELPGCQFSYFDIYTGQRIDPILVKIDELR